MCAVCVCAVCVRCVLRVLFVLCFVMVLFLLPMLWFCGWCVVCMAPTRDCAAAQTIRNCGNYTWPHPHQSDGCITPLHYCWLRRHWGQRSARDCGHNSSHCRYRDHPSHTAASVASAPAWGGHFAMSPPTTITDESMAPSAANRPPSASPCRGPSDAMGEVRQL